MSFYDLATVDFSGPRPPQGDREPLKSGVGGHLRTLAAHESAGGDEGAGGASSARVTPFVAPPALGELITIVLAAEIADRMWHENRLKFYTESLVALGEDISLLQLIRERIAARLDAYLEYEVFR